MNDLIMPVLLTMITSDIAFNQLSKKTQYMIKALVIMNMVLSATKLIKNIIKAIGDFKVKESQ